MNLNGENEELHHGLKLLAKSSVIVFIGVFLSKLFTILYKIIIGNYFASEIYGLFTLSLIVVGFFVSFSSLGLTEGLARFVPFFRGKNQKDKIAFIFRKTSFILFFSSVIFSAIMFFLSEFISVQIFHSEELIPFLKTFSFLVPLTIFSYIFLNIIKGHEKIGWHSFIWNILQNFVKVATILILIFVGIKSNAIIFSYTLGIFSMLVVAYLFCKKKFPFIFKKKKIKEHEKKEISKSFFSYSWPLLFSGIITTLFYWIDSFLIGYFLNASEVGIYNAATPLVGLMSFAPSLFTQLFFPMIIRKFSEKKIEVVRELSKQIGKWILILNLPFFIIMFLFPGAMIHFLFKPVEYFAAQNALRILSIGGLFSSFMFLSSDLISMIGKSKLILINIVSASVLNIFLNSLLIPKYGIDGAAIATTIVWILLAVTLFIEVKFYSGIFLFRKKLIKIILVSFIPISLTILLRRMIAPSSITPILVGIFFILLYFLLIFLTGCLDKNDLAILKSIRKRFSKSKY